MLADFLAYSAPVIAVGAVVVVVLTLRLRRRDQTIAKLHQEIRDLLADSSSELKVSEAKYRTLNRFLPAGVLRTDRALAAVYVSDRWCDMAGVAEGQALGERWQSRIHEADRPRVLAAFADAVRKEGRLEQNFRLVSPTGRTLWVLCNGGVEEHDHEPHFVAVFTDVTRLKEAQEQLEARARQWESLLENSPDPIYLHDSEGKLLRVNFAAAELHGLPRDAFVGKPVAEVMTWGSGHATPGSGEEPSIDSPGLEASAMETPNELEGWALRADGARVEIAIRASATVYNGHSAFLVIVRDVSERRRNEMRLRLFESAVKHADEAFVISEARPGENPLMIPVFVNDAFTRATGYTLDDIREVSLNALLGPWTDVEKAAQIGADLAAGRVVQAELQLRRRNGQPYWALFSMVPVHDTHGAITYWVSVTHDISDRKAVEEALQKAKESAEAANRIKSEFLANVSHEIRTPMTAILGFTDMLDQTIRDEAAADWNEIRDLVQTVHRNGEHLLELINGILDLSKVESGKLEMQTGPLELPELMSDLVSLMRVRAVQKRIDLRLKFTGPVPRIVATDATRLRQILINLIGNAIKFTDSGHVEIRVHPFPSSPEFLAELGEGATSSGPTAYDDLLQAVPRAAAASDGAAAASDPAEEGKHTASWYSRASGAIAEADDSSLGSGSDGEPRRILAFEVEDTGIGMTQAEVGRLFQPFYQADASNTRRFSGTGLGLAISRRLTEALGGRIMVDTAIGVGSRFTVALPVDVPPGTVWLDEVDEATAVLPNPPAPASEAPRLNCHVLLAEDGPDNQRAICFFLRKAGATVEVVDDGRAAFERASRTDRGPAIDLILMDMQMPIMDGYTATKNLRALGYAGPIMALTADAMSGSRERCLEVGCDDYAVKPIQRVELIKQVDKLVRRNAGMEPPTSS